MFIHRIKYNNEIEYLINDIGTKRYYKIGTNILHRLDGPAIEFTNGYKEYYIRGEYIDFFGKNEEWIIKNLLE